MLGILPYWFGAGALARLIHAKVTNENRMLFAICSTIAAIVLFAILKIYLDLPPTLAILLFSTPSYVVGLIGAGIIFNSQATLQQNLGVAAAALFIVIATLDFQYDLFRSLSNFSAGGVSMSFGPSKGTGDDAASRPSVQNLNKNSEVGLPRTISIIYVTQQLQRVARFLEQDDSLARFVSKTTQEATTLDPYAARFLSFAQNWLVPVGCVMETKQTTRRSEFPSLAAVSNISETLRRAYDDYEAIKTDPKIESEIEDAIAEVNRSLTIIVGELRPDMPTLLKCASDFETVKAKDYPVGEPLPPSLCFPGVGCGAGADYPFERVYFSSKSDYEESNYGSYLAVINAFAEDVQSNRESAIQLLDDRIVSEKLFLQKHPLWENSILPEERYKYIRKELLLLRLMRWETTLIQFIPYSEVLTLLAFKRYEQTVVLSGRLIALLDIKSELRNALVAATPLRNGTSCLGPLPWETWQNKSLFFRLVYAHFAAENNAVYAAATSSQIVAPEGRIDWPLVQTLDRWANDLDRLNLGCLKSEGASVDNQARAYITETFGSWRQMYAKNFLVEPFKADVGQACGAIRAYESALALYVSDDPDPAASEFRKELSANFDISFRYKLRERIGELKDWIRHHYSQADIPSGCVAR